MSSVNGKGKIWTSSLTSFGFDVMGVQEAVSWHICQVTRMRLGKPTAGLAIQVGIG